MSADHDPYADLIEANQEAIIRPAKLPFKESARSGLTYFGRCMSRRFGSKSRKSPRRFATSRTPAPPPPPPAPRPRPG
jgi:hypothetical protein